MCVRVCVSLCQRGSPLCLLHNSGQVAAASVTWHTYTRCGVGALSLRCHNKYSASSSARPPAASCCRYLSPYFVLLSLSTPPPPPPSPFCNHRPPAGQSGVVVNKREIAYSGLPDAGWKHPPPLAAFLFGIWCNLTLLIHSVVNEG